jgi:tetratricopeptide (TPR) repeat protein
VRTAPEAAESWRCFYLAARRGGDWDRARERLEAEARKHPENAHTWLNLAHIEAAVGGGQGVELYEAAVARYGAAGDAAGLTQAHIGLAIHRSHLGAPLEEVLEGLDAAEAAALEADPVSRATVQAQRARVLWRSGGDLGAAYALVREAEQHAFPDGPYQLRLVVLHVLAGICQEIGRLDEAHAAGVRMVELTAAEGDRYVEATARLNVAQFALSNPDRVPPGTGERESREALAAAEDVGNPFILAGARCTRAGILQQQGQPSLGEWERCVTAYGELGEPLMAALGEVGVASALAETDPARALERAEGVVRAARAGGDESLEVLGRLAVAGLRWQVEGPAAGTAAFAAHHAAAERLVDHQTDAASRAGVLSNLTDGHHLLAWLSVQQSPAATDAALAELERLRARELGDQLRRTELLPPRRPEDEAQLATLAAQLTQLNIALGSAKTAAERDALAHRRERLERAEGVVRDRLARGTHPTGRAAPRLAELQAALAPGEVILSYQTPPLLAQLPVLQAPPWVMAISQDGVGTAILTDRRALEALVPTVAGLFTTGQPSPATARAAAATWDQLVAPGLAALGRDPSTPPERLILLLDGPLHELPFAALRPAADQPPLGATTALSRVPSLTSWLALRDLPEAPAGPSLVLGDPPWPRAAGAPLAALPAARWEAQSVGEALGAVALVGKLATEAAVKGLRQPPPLLHLAAHGRDPRGTASGHALVLGEGGGEDGLLEAREVRDLPLAGTLVVLSACRGASGRVLEGDGLDGLSRGFLLAGAPVVVGSLWPVPDGAAARFFARFAGALSEGLPIDDALKHVRASMIAEGLPPAAWAGMVAIGDGGRRVAPAPAEGQPLWVGLLLAVGAAVVGAAGARLAQR